MSDTAIRAENVSKQYHIGVGGRALLKETVMHSLKTVFSKNGKKINPEEFWALQDVSFEIKKGESVGVIGRNGAGKSTLLKILSRVTSPTTGRVTVDGKVASLLEVGTGSHPELTGRENILINAAILGMKRMEIKKKFDEIVAFAGIEKFLDTPVKHYSSGMYVRLSFAVAAFANSDILIVDEVLAVGDAEFQKKGLERMADLNRNLGKTLLFVSHNVELIRSLCKRGILIDRGKLVEDTTAQKAIDRYMDIIKGDDIVRESIEKRKSMVSGECLILEAKIQNGSGEVSREFQTGDAMNILLTVKVKRELLSGIGIVADVRDLMDKEIVTTIKKRLTRERLNEDTELKIRVEIPELLLTSGSYELDIRVTNYELHKVYDFLDSISSDLFFNVSAGEKESKVGVGAYVQPAKVYFDTITQNV